MKQLVCFLLVGLALITLQVASVEAQDSCQGREGQPGCENPNQGNLDQQFDQGSPNQHINQGQPGDACQGREGQPGCENPNQGNLNQNDGGGCINNQC